MIYNNGNEWGESGMINKKRTMKTEITYFPIENLINGHQFEIEFLISSW